MQRDSVYCRKNFLKTAKGISTKAWSDSVPSLPCNQCNMNSKTSTKLLEGFDSLSAAIMLVVNQRKEGTPVESRQERRDSIESHQALTVAQEDRIKKQEALTVNLQAQVALLSTQVSGLTLQMESHICINNISVVPAIAASTPIKPKQAKDLRYIPPIEDYPENLSTQNVFYSDVHTVKQTLPKIPSSIIPPEAMQEASKKMEENWLTNKPKREKKMERAGLITLAQKKLKAQELLKSMALTMSFAVPSGTLDHQVGIWKKEC